MRRRPTPATIRLWASAPLATPWGSTITYAWIQTGGEDVTLTGKDTATPTFTAPDEAGDLVFELTVTGAPGPEKQPLSPRSILASLRSHLQHFLPRLLPSCRWAAIPPPPVVHFGVALDRIICNFR